MYNDASFVESMLFVIKYCSFVTDGLHSQSTALRLSILIKMCVQIMLHHKEKFDFFPPTFRLIRILAAIKFIKLKIEYQLMNL